MAVCHQVTVLPPGEWDPSIRIEPPTSLPSQVFLIIPLASQLCVQLLIMSLQGLHLISFIWESFCNLVGSSLER